MEAKTTRIDRGALADHRLPPWEETYRRGSPEELPWFYPDLDPDLDRVLKARGLTSGSVLDLGSGPGTQAVALAERGLEVTAVDISPSAVEQARARAAARGVRVRFLVDDVLESRVEGPFDAAIDRGCFHVFDPSDRPRYVRTLARLLRSGGLLILKCFSHETPGTYGPRRLHPREIPEIFSPSFEILSIEPALFQGSPDPPPKALLCVLKRR